MGCCGQTTTNIARAPATLGLGQQPATVRVRVETAAEEAKYRAAFPGYSVQKISVGSTGALLVFTK